MVDPVLKLAQLTDFFWNEKKALSFEDERSHKKTIKKLKKIWDEIKNLKIDDELALLCDMHGIDKNILNE